MKTLLKLLVPVVLTGCATRTEVGRLTNDTLAAGAGAVVADKLSRGNPYWTAAGAVTAVAAERMATSATDADRATELKRAYEQGKAQNAQATYQAIQNAQRLSAPVAAESSGVEVPITVPERTINGVKLKESTEYVRLTTP